MSSPFCKNIPIFSRNKSVYDFPIPPTPKGRFAIVTNVGRDAVDAEVPLTKGTEADDEDVWSRRLEVGVKPTVVLIRRRRCQESLITGESTR
jgi:hypothetical protein